MTPMTPAELHASALTLIEKACEHPIDGCCQATMTPHEVERIVYDALMLRAIDPTLCRERARNIACALIGVTVTGG